MDRVCLTLHHLSVQSSRTASWELTQLDHRKPRMLRSVLILMEENSSTQCLVSWMFMESLTKTSMSSLLLPTISASWTLTMFSSRQKYWSAFSLRQKFGVRSSIAELTHRFFTIFHHRLYTVIHCSNSLLTQERHRTWEVLLCLNFLGLKLD